MRSLLVVAAFLLGLQSPARGLSLEDATEFCKGWFDALVLGEKDLEETVLLLLEKYYTNETILIDPNFSEPQKGIEAIRLYYTAVLSKYPNWSFKVEKIYPTEEGFVLHYTGHVPGVVDHFHGIDILEINAAGKITKLVEGYDRVPFQRPPQVGR